MTGLIEHTISPLRLTGDINRLYVTSDFGSRGAGYHHGIDLVGYDGTLRKTDVIVPIAGVVTRNYWSETVGWVVHIKHQTIITRYYHLEKQSALQIGQSVAVGDLIGPMGSTGSTSNGNHLHFEVRDLTDSEAQDPKPWIRGEKTDGKAPEQPENGGQETQPEKATPYLRLPYRNGSTKEYVYSTTKEALAGDNSIGYLDPHQSGNYIARYDACPVVVYHNGISNKVGFVKYEGGVPIKDTAKLVRNTYQNGSTRENVYATTKDAQEQKNAIGYLDPWQKCDCVGRFEAYPVVVYFNGTSNKTGFVRYEGGLVY